jgi:DNA-binding LacI/PurR family transcriptional regulator
VDRTQLTTVEQPIMQIAGTAVGTLHSLIADPDRPLPSSYFRPALRVRGSTAAPAVRLRPRAAATS